MSEEEIQSSFEGLEPEIEYPCLWSYRLIGPDEPQLRAHVAEVMAEREHFVELARKSSGGRYVSLRLEVTVVDEGDRKGLFAQLEQGEGILYVL